MNHCVYCGEAIPAELKAGFEEPEALKWVERPGLPADAHRQLEMMKVVPMEARKPVRNVGKIVGLLSLPIFAVLIYLTYTLMKQLSPSASTLILVAGAGVLGYVAYTFVKASKK
jgi:hypothetical protein